MNLAGTKRTGLSSWPKVGAQHRFKHYVIAFCRSAQRFTAHPYSNYALKVFFWKQVRGQVELNTKDGLKRRGGG